MCWLPIDQPLLRPGDSSCSARRRQLSTCSVAQLLAARLRSIGDQLEKSWTARETKVGSVCGDRERGRPVVEEMVAAAAATRSSRRLKGFLCLAVHFTLLVLLGARRHL